MKKSITSENQSKIEIALKESEQRYRTTMMSVGDGVVATDADGRVEIMNPIAEELIIANKELAFQNREKEKRAAELIIANKELAFQNREKEKRAAELILTNKELEAFSYSVSHDLRAPLRHVSGYVELLNKHFKSELPEKGQHYLSSIADSVRLMGTMIDDLLQFSRSSRTEMRQSDIDMNEIVKEITDSLHKDNPDRKIEWVHGKLPSIFGDEAMFRLVWMNLLNNAVKFTQTRKKARIEIGVRNENKELVFYVRDNGVGFDMQYAQKLFGVFQRLHPTEEFEGTGVGLANVNRIVLRHGGRTWAEAKPDKGAVFYFSMPKNKEER
jgi:light-regulated signal transduction histidine kinase (bacteriophytochrome)